MKFFKLFNPIKIGQIELKNRIVMPAMHTGYAKDAFVTERLIDFYTERARGGAALLLIGGCHVSKVAMGLPSMIGISDDKYLPGLTDLSNEVHEAEINVKVGAQLYHSGRYAFPFIIGEQPVSASAIYSRFSKTTPRELSNDEIKEVHNQFAAAAVRSKDSGFDIVEVCASAGYLVGQFLSLVVNKRTDRYGGDLESRLNFPLELIETVRGKIGNFTFGFRESGDDFMPGGLTYNDKRKIAIEYEKAGLDFINVTGGWHETKVPQITADVPPGAYSYLAENIKNVLSIPVFASNRINDPLLAEEILIADKADCICMGRALIADPYLPNKAMNGELRDIRHCVACNQGCFDRIFIPKPIQCLRNAQAGNEKKYKLKKIDSVKKVMIIGAGPAGLEAARIARMRSHTVELFDKADKIGGLIYSVYTPPGRQEFEKMIDYYKYQIEKLGINLHLNINVTEQIIEQINPEVIIFAIGTIPIIPNIPGIDNENVFLATDILEREAPLGKNVVIIGGGGTGIEVAIYAAKYGAMKNDVLEFLTFYNCLEPEVALNMLHKGNKKVTVLEMLPRPGSDIGKTTKWTLLGKCDKLGVNIITNANITKIEKNRIIYSLPDQENLEIEDVDTYIIATGVKPNNELYNQVKNTGKFKSLFLIGDCREPATILEAIHRAYRVANKI
ncbi:MAG: FAD-dependent oxidoreductase [Candidatus Lokiarchaeota archaeon]|nr:FAD-dependent oxidoreductase [Candidatus Lokiarchaeota archaeon]MCK4281986.1 FAD-dependent oxidoreductase [Candidatus Lokiarchaeota archaeon]